MSFVLFILVNFAFLILAIVFIEVGWKYIERKKQHWVRVGSLDEVIEKTDIANAVDSHKHDEGIHRAMHQFIEEDVPLLQNSVKDACTVYSSTYEPLLFEVIRYKETFTFYVRTTQEEARILYSFRYEYGSEQSFHVCGEQAWEEHFYAMRTKVIQQFCRLPEVAFISKELVTSNQANPIASAERITDMYKHNIHWEKDDNSLQQQTSNLLHLPTALEEK